MYGYNCKKVYMTRYIAKTFKISQKDGKYNENNLVQKSLL